MRTWSNSSSNNLITCDPKLEWLMTKVRDEVADISILEGYRDEARQNQMFDEGKSTLRFPDGNHNVFPSMAVDFQPYPMPVSKKKLWAALAYIAGRAIEIGKQNNIKIRWGGDWNMNGDLTDQNFDDLYHLELLLDT